MKVIIFSHGADIDGMGGIILAKLAFNDVDYVFAENTTDLENIFLDYFDNDKLYKYSKIFITDLALTKPAIDYVDSNSIIRTKIKIFDHHKSSLDAGLDKYPFSHIVVEGENCMRCGTDLFYEYLVSNGFLAQTPALDEFVELTRLVDTWEWKKSQDKGIKAGNLAVLFNAIGKNNYIINMLNKLTSEKSFELNDREEAIVKMKRREYGIIMGCLWDSKEYYTDEFGNKYAALYANHEYIGDLIEYVRNLSHDDIKYLVTIDLNKGEYGQKSYRNVDETFDVSKIAVVHGGGGHMAASGVNITCEQKEYASTLNKKEALKYLVDSSFTNEKTI